MTEVANARPEISKAVETMIKKGKWTVPGYRVSLLLDIVHRIKLTMCRRSSESSHSCREIDQTCMFGFSDTESCGRCFDPQIKTRR